MHNFDNNIFNYLLIKIIKKLIF